MEILVAGSSVLNKTTESSVKINLALQSRSTASITLRDSSGTYDVVVGALVQIYDGAGTTVFGGTVEEVQKQVLEDVVTEIQLTCVSHEQRLDKRIVQSKIYSNTTAGAVVADLITSYANGELIFLDEPSDVQDGANVETIIYDYDKRLSEALDELATLSNYVWYVDPDGYLFFVPRTAYAAPFSLSNADVLSGSVTVRRSRTDLRNREWYRVNWATFPPTVESFAGDGSAIIFSLDKPVNRIDSIKVDGNEVSYGVFGVDDGREWYFAPGSFTITQDGSGTPLTAEQTIEIAYRGLGDDVIMADDLAAIAARAAAETGTGIYEHYTDDQTAVDAATALAKAQSLVAAYKNIALTVEFSTIRAGLKPGQVLNCSITKPTVSGSWLIEQVEATADLVAGEHDFRYRVTIIDGSRIGGWLNFWEKLAGVATNGGGISLGGSTGEPAPEIPELEVPVQPTTDGWSVAIGEYGAKLGGQPVARIRVTITERPEGTRYFGAWLYKGASAPTDPTAFVNVASQPISESGNTYVDFWVDRDTNAVTYQVAITASGQTFVVPDGAVVKSVVVAAAEPAPQVSVFDVDVEPGDNGGVPSGRYVYTFVPPVHLEYWTTRIERIWCDETYAPVSGAVWEEVANIVEGAYTGDWWPLPTNAEYWQFRARTLTRAGIFNNTSIPTVNVNVPASSGVGPVPLAPPVESPTASYRYTDYRDGRGIRLELVGNYTIPDPAGTLDGAVLYYELTDQSNAPVAVAGEALADGASNAGGEWRPQRGAEGRDRPLVIPDLDPVSTATEMRLIFSSVNTAQVENALVRPGETGATPSATVTVDPPEKGPTGEEFCPNPQSPIVSSNAWAFEGAVRVRRIKSIWDRIGRASGAYIEVIYRDENGAVQVNVAVAIGSEGENWFPDPKIPQIATIRWRGFVDQFDGVEDDLINSYERLITPETTIAIGTSDGTVDLGEGVAATVSAAMTVINKVLGVATNGITEALIATFAVSQEKIANIPVIDTARIVDEAVANSKLGALSVDTAKLAALAVSQNKLQDLAVSAAKLGDLSVGTNKMVDAAVTNPKYADLSVGTAKMADLAVNNAKMGDLSVSSGKIQLLAVGQSAIALLAVGAAQMADLAVTTGKMDNLAVTNAKLANLAVTNAKLDYLSVLAANIGDAQVGTAKMQNLAVTNAIMSYLAVGTAQIQDFAVTDGKIANLSVGKLTAGAMLVASPSAAAITVTNGINSTSISASTYSAATPSATAIYGSEGFSLTPSAPGPNYASFNMYCTNLLYFSAVAGGIAPPATVYGYLRVEVNGVWKKIPLYND